jgi:hypothetical protein
VLDGNLIPNPAEQATLAVMREMHSKGGMKRLRAPVTMALMFGSSLVSLIPGIAILSVAGSQSPMEQL